jgi:dienelactone hydrolase
MDSDRYASEHFTFASEAGERVAGILLKAANSERQRPVVAVLHGTGAKKEDELPLLRALADRGFVAVAIDARHHGERARSAEGAQGGEYVEALLRAFRTGVGYPYMYDTVWDTMRLVDYLQTREDVDPTRVALLGISKGGTETYLTAAADPRIAVAVPVIGVQSFRWALDHDAWQSRAETFQDAIDAIAHDAGATHADSGTVARFYARVAPGIDGDFDAPNMLPLIAPRPLLIISGDSDPRTPLGGVQQCVASAGRAYGALASEDKFGLYLQPGAGHVFTPTGELVALDWLVRWLTP